MKVLRDARVRALLARRRAARAPQHDAPRTVPADPFAPTKGDDSPIRASAERSSSPAAGATTASTRRQPS